MKKRFLLFYEGSMGAHIYLAGYSRLAEIGHQPTTKELWSHKQGEAIAFSDIQQVLDVMPFLNSSGPFQTKTIYIK